MATTTRIPDRAARRVSGTCVDHPSQPRPVLPALASDDHGGYDIRSAASHVTHDGRGTARPTADAGSVEGLASLVEQLTEQLGHRTAVDLEQLGPALLRQQIDLLRRLEGLTASAMATTVGALERTGGMRDDGASSTTAWVAANTGRSRREASRTTRRASSLPDLPATAAALAAGEVGVESADAIVSTSRDGRLGTPAEVEAQLLPVAREETPERLRAEVRRRTQQVDGAAMLRDEDRQRQRRRLTLNHRDDGMWDLYGQLTAEVGNKFRTLLDAFDRPDAPETPSGQRRRPDQRMADALEAATDVALDVGNIPTTGGVARPHVSVIVDVATFDADLSDPADPHQPVSPTDPAWAKFGGAETEWAGTLSPQAAVKLCCDAGVSRVVMAGTSQVLDVGRETRKWSAPQRRAINARDRCCRGPGCGRPIGWTQIHHLRWWRRHGDTNIDNGLALCSSCHDLIHHLGWHAELDVATAAVTWTSPDRRRTVVTHPRPPT